MSARSDKLVWLFELENRHGSHTFLLSHSAGATVNLLCCCPDVSSAIHLYELFLVNHLFKFATEITVNACAEAVCPDSPSSASAASMSAQSENRQTGAEGSTWWEERSCGPRQTRGLGC